VKIKTSELTGAALDWAVAKCDGLNPLYLRGFDFEPTWRNGHRKRYSTDWTQGGPIIEREMLTVGPAKHEGYMAWAWPKAAGYWGDTPLIAAMRCYVASKLGDEVDVPDELL
jgi:hypothetical protein